MPRWVWILIGIAAFLFILWLLGIGIHVGH